MPTYEYRCKKGHVFERLQTMNDAPLKRCEKCKGPVERLIGSGAGLIFKGTGFYSTDYKESSATQKADPSSGGKSPAAPAPIGKADSSAKGGSASGGKPAPPTKPK